MSVQPVKILMTSYYMPSESKIGVGYQVHALANTLARRGHEVTVVTPCSPSDGAEYRTLVVQVPGPLRTFRWAFALRRLDMSGFDVLHSHGDDYWLWRRRVPVHVRTMHGSCLAEALKVPGGFEKLRMLLLGLGELLATVVADRTVAVSRNTLRWMPWVRNVIPNGVDLSRFGTASAVRAEQPTILFVGTYANRKRGKLLMDAFTREVRPALPDARLWMVCEDAPAASGVEVLGRLSDVALAKRYQQAWVFCLPSSYEGFGIPYVEALAAGLPVVATANPGAREVLGDGAFGDLVGDEEIGQTLIRHLSGGFIGTSAAANDHARQYDLNVVAEKYEQLYAQLSARPARSKAGHVG